MKTHKSTCRLCINCGFEFDVEENSILEARPNRDYIPSRGYACSKGFDYIEFLRGNGVPRLTHSLKRSPKGGHEKVDVHQAIVEIADKLRPLIAEHGPRSVAFYTGTGSYANTLGYGMCKALIHELDTPNLFSTLTIDQPQKVLTPARMGMYLGGKRSHLDVDVMLTAGNNPFVSHLGNPQTPAAGFDPGRSARYNRERGVTHIVVDPRLSETARRADLHLQIIPGEDATLFAAIVNQILSNHWYNRDFCDQFVDGVERLRDITAEFTPARAAQRCGVAESDIIEAARLFGHAERPMAGGATGICMGPFSNLSDFLIESLNALCGGYRLPGETVRNPGFWFAMPPIAEVTPPDRSWEREPLCHSVEAGQICGEFPTPLMPDEILTDGPNKIRALIIFCGNPAVAMVDPDKTLAALHDLDLLVTLDQRETETTALSDYVLATSSFYERHELSGYMDVMFDETMAELTTPVVEKPPAVIHDWEFFFELAQHLGLSLEYKYLGLLMQHALQPPGLMLDMTRKPREEDIINWVCENRGISMEALLAHPGGMKLERPPVTVAPPPAGKPSNRLQVCPNDVAADIKRLAASTFDTSYRYRLASRRISQVMNSVLRHAPSAGERAALNYAYLNPEDLSAEGLEDGDCINIESAFAQLRARVKADKTVRRGVISMTHCFVGGDSAHSGQLVPLAEGFREPVTFMPHQTGVPVNLSPVPNA